MEQEVPAGSKPVFGCGGKSKNRKKEGYENNSLQEFHLFCILF